ncbi:MAG: virulence RhuM family protein [Micropruina sp.]|nr:MAG: virulence RhuM family protein [Micropruina sp.]
MVPEPSPGEIVIYQSDSGAPAIEVRLDDETVWVTQAQLVELFQSSKANISEHISNIFDEGEVDPSATVRDFRTVRTEGSREVTRTLTYYNLDVILSVGYRVRSKTATQFRIWATERLREYLVKGFTMDDAKLKTLGGGTYWRELLDRIRDIRSSEKVLYRQVLDLYATSVDYDPKADETVEFFKIVQNKLHFAAHGHTAAEVIASRADATQPNMGLTTFAGARPVKAEIGIAKNYLNENELKKLNTLVSAYFDAAEFRAQNHQPTYMRDWIAHLDRIITAMEAPTLSGAGSVSHKQAVAKAEDEYEKYRAQLDVTPSDVEAAYLESVKRTQREIEGKQL